jgi:hypothetical protein
MHLTMDIASLSLMSPSKTCKVRVSSTRYRNDPYRARVNALVKPGSPMFVPRAAKVAQPKPAAVVIAEEILAADVPAADVSMADILIPTVPVAAPAPLPTVAPKSFAAAAMTSAVVVAAPKVAPAKDALSASSSGKQHYALIGFKHEASMFQAPFRVAVGDVVIVEADRGEHIGIVQSITTTAPAYNVPCRIVRHANIREFETIDELTLKEKKVTAGVQKLSESLGLGIRVVDTEFQMDGNKLTVFFSSKVFVDFRKLQRSLFRDYRCRIWLVNWSEIRPYTPVPVNPVC